MHPLILGCFGTCPSLLFLSCNSRLINERVASHKQISILVHFILEKVLFLLIIARVVNAGVCHSSGCFLDFPHFCIDSSALWGGRPFSLWCLDCCFFRLGLGCLGEIIQEIVRFYDGSLICRRGSTTTTLGRLSPLENVFSIHDRFLVLYFDLSLII